jgi:uncharacterized membrane protein
VLIPIQYKQAKLAKQFAHGGIIPQEYWRLGRIWMAVGIIAILLPLLSVVLMVFKPT